MDPFQNKLPITPEQILEILLRRKWYIIVPLCISLTVGIFQILTAGKTYEASTLILVQPQRVPTNYVRSVVTTTISQRISTISQQILSRSNLEKIIDQFDLFADSPEMYLEDKVALMRNRVRVKIEHSRQGTEAFSIVFKGSEPQRVMRIANTLASYFMDENLKVREAQAVGTSEFLDSELEKTRIRLEEREKRLADYRRKHFGGLPDELDANLRTLDRLQQKIVIGHETLRQAKSSLSILETQIAQSKEMASQGFDDSLSGFNLDNQEAAYLSEDEQKLEIAKKTHDNLLLRYTEKHPDLLKLKKTIEKLEAAIAEEKTTKEAMAENETDAIDSEVEQNKDGFESNNYAAMQQETQLKQIKNEIKKIQSDIADTEAQMKIYQKRVEDTPKRELEMQALQRDYANIQNVYNSLLDRKLEAELSVNMEKKQKGEQFRILDHARIPEKPISPNVKLLSLMSIAIGLGVGAGIIFLFEFLNTSIRREQQIEEDLGLKVLVSVPPIETDKDRFKEKLEIVGIIVLSLYAGSSLIFLYILNVKGLDRTINFIKTTLNI